LNNNNKSDPIGKPSMQLLLKHLTILALTAALLGCNTAPPKRDTQAPAPTAVSVVDRNAKAPNTSATLKTQTPRHPLKIGFVYVGPIGDAGWTYQHDLARRAVEQSFGNRVQTTYVENVSEFGNGEVFRQLAAQDHTLIFATTFGYLKQIETVAPTLPEVKFEHAQGYRRAKNVRTYDVRTYEGAYLAGMLAGGMSRSNRLGVVASIPIPEMVSVINAYTLGAQAVNPKIITQIEWVTSWFDPPKEAAAAEKLFKRGVDVIFQTTDSVAVLQAAERRGRRGIAWDSDMKAFAPHAQLGAVEVNWTPYYLQVVEQVLNGTWATGTSWWGIDQKAIDLRHLSSDVPESLKAHIDAARTGIADGSFKIWRGPLRDNQKRLVLAPEQVAEDRHVVGMNYLVLGVEGRLP
jgi:basic membrane protein A